MTRESFDDESEVRAALQDLFHDRFEGVDWERLNARIVADAVEGSTVPSGPAEVLAAWSPRASLTAGGLIAAGVTVLLLVSGRVEADAVPAGFWPVAEELLAGLPPDARRLLDAGSEPQALLELITADIREEASRR
jgi:hypothetical protein